METKSLSEFQEQDPSQFSPPNQNSLSLAPYARVDGQWTVSDSVALAFAEACSADGLVEQVFYSGRVRTPEQMVETFKQPQNVPVFVLRDGVPIAAGWLNAIQDNHAMAHCCMLRSGWGRDSVPAGRMVMNYWMSFRRDTGHPLFDVLFAVIPALNPRAVAFARKLGFVLLGDVPMLVQNGRTGGKEPGSILHYTRS